MLKLFDRNHNPLDILTGYKDCYIEEVLKTGTKNIGFSISSTNPLVDKIEEEGYLQTEDYEFVIKEYIKQNNDFYEVFGQANIEALAGTPIQKFSSETHSVADTVGQALAHVPSWDFVDLSGVTKRRTLRKENGTVYDIINYCRSVFGVEMEYDTMKKIVYIHASRGTDKGIFLTNEHDMREFKIQSTSYDFITRLYPFGKEDDKGVACNITSVNGGKNYIENFTYSNKVVAAIWVDQRYTIPQNLLDDAIEKLAELSQPAHSYSTTLVNLDREVEIGDTLTFMDSLKRTREKQRVVKITRYPLKPEEDKVELSNTRISFADKIAALDEAAQLIEDNTDDAGVILYAENAGHAESGGGGGGGGGGGVPDPLTINKINAAEIEVGNLIANDATVTDLDVTNGDIINLYSDDAFIKKLEVDDIKANFGIQTDSITVTGGYIGTLTSENFTAGSISTDILDTSSAWIDQGMIQQGAIGTAQIADGSITNAKIVELTANKITSGELSVERLIISGNNKSIVFAINNMGELVSKNVNSIDGGVLTERSVTADRIVASSITSNEIAAKSITTNNIAANAITTAELAAGAVQATNIASNAVQTGHLDAYSVTSVKIAAGAITADKIDTKAIMASNLSDDVFDSFRDEIQDQINLYKKDVEQYMNFDTRTGLTLGGVGSDFAVNIGNQEIDFKQGSDTVAYINNNKISITDGEILNELRIGNYVFRPRANGNMSLIYEEV